MTFTNTKSVGNNWYWHEAWREVNRQVKYQVNDHFCCQVTSQVYKQISPTQTKITQETRK